MACIKKNHFKVPTVSEPSTFLLLYPYLNVKNLTFSMTADNQFHVIIINFQMESVASLTGVPNTELNSKISSLEKENVDLKKAIDDLRNLVISLQARVETLETTSGGGAKAEAPKVF